MVRITMRRRRALVLAFGLILLAVQRDAAAQGAAPSPTSYRYTVSPAPTKGYVQLQIIENGKPVAPIYTCGQADAGPRTQCSVSAPAGKVVRATVVPMKGYRFATWSGVCSGRDALLECDYTLTSDKTMSATFGSIAAGSPTYRFTMSPAPANGYIEAYAIEGFIPQPGQQARSTGRLFRCGAAYTGPNAQCSFMHSANKHVTVKAVPNPGFKLLSWSGGSTGSGLTLQMQGDIKLTATFGPSAPTP